jgi:hypothetical protein
MTTLRYHYSLLWALLRLVVWLGLFAANMFLIFKYSPTPPASIPLVLLMIYLPFLIYGTIRRRIIPSILKQTVLSIDIVGIYIKDYPNPIRWNQIESVTTDRIGFVFAPIRLRLSNPNWLLIRYGSRMPNWTQKINSYFNCDLMLFPGAYNVDAGELLNSIIGQIPDNQSHAPAELMGLLATISENKLAYSITLNEGATDQQIAGFEQTMQLILPEDIRSFYLYCNGFVAEADEFRLIPLDEIIARRCEDLFNPGVFVIAEFMNYADSWLIAIKHDGYLIYDGSDFVRLTDSFPEFLTRYLAGGVSETGGLYDWAEDHLPDTE